MASYSKMKQAKTFELQTFSTRIYHLLMIPKGLSVLNFDPFQAFS